MTTRVLIADDHPLYRAGLRLMLDGRDEIAIVGDAASVPDVFAAVAESTPDVVIMDVSMPGGDGIDATAQLVTQRPQLAVLIVSMFDDAATVARAMRSGARGYLVKGAGGDDVLRAVRAVAAGQIVLDGAAGGAFLRGSGTQRDSAGSDITDRESDILRLMAAGLTNAAIADALHLSDKTVRNYVSSIFHKIGATSRVDAVVRARKAGLG